MGCSGIIWRRAPLVGVRTSSTEHPRKYMRVQSGPKAKPESKAKAKAKSKASMHHLIPRIRHLAEMPVVSAAWSQAPGHVTSHVNTSPCVKAG